ncbi:hypothetical protein GGF50DRAFT_125280 [Schizophyllum commune]
MPALVDTYQPSYLCDHCHTRPRFKDGSTGYKYCGRSCATAASKLCEYCHSRPKYKEGKRIFPHCGRLCASAAAEAAAKAAISATVKPPSSPQPAAAASSSATTCTIADCGNSVYRKNDGTLSKYCSLKHRNLAEHICLLCRKNPTDRVSAYCGRACRDTALDKGPLVLKVPVDHDRFRSVARQFQDSWRHRTSIPAVRQIYFIQPPREIVNQYKQYREEVESRGHFTAQGLTKGNENRRWHGTKRQCRLGDDGQNHLCDMPSCSLCSIIRTSFDLSFFKGRTGWGRFGKGLYTSSTSSKANDYSMNAGDTPSTCKAILLTKVVVGRGHKMLHDKTDLTEPPVGHDSVLAEVGGSLNYDELVVYRNEAIKPAYLVVYDSK